MTELRCETEPLFTRKRLGNDERSGIQHVHLGDLGSFRLSIKASGYETSAEAKKAGANAIKAVNVQFTKSVAMREALSTSAVELGLLADVTND